MQVKTNKVVLGLPTSKGQSYLFVTYSILANRLAEDSLKSVNLSIGSEMLFETIPIFASRHLLEVLIFQGPNQGFACFRRTCEHKTLESNKSQRALHDISASHRGSHNPVATLGKRIERLLLRRRCHRTHTDSPHCSQRFRRTGTPTNEIGG